MRQVRCGGKERRCCSDIEKKGSMTAINKADGQEVEIQLTPAAQEEALRVYRQNIVAALDFRDKTRFTFAHFPFNPKNPVDPESASAKAAADAAEAERIMSNENRLTRHATHVQRYETTTLDAEDSKKLKFGFAIAEDITYSKFNIQSVIVQYEEGRILIFYDNAEM